MTVKSIQIFLIVILLNLTCFLGVMIVSAYLLAEDTAENCFSVGGNETAVIEDYDEVSRLEPGMTVDKVVKVKNTGKNECYVRVLVLFSDSTAEEYARININNTDWQQNDDGYYYYNEILKAKESTTAFKSFDIPASWGNEMADLTFYVNVTAEFIQAEHFTPKYTDETKKVIADWGTVSIDSYKKN